MGAEIISATNVTIIPSINARQKDDCIALCMPLSLFAPKCFATTTLVPAVRLVMEPTSKALTEPVAPTAP